MIRRARALAEEGQGAAVLAMGVADGALADALAATFEHSMSGIAMLDTRGCVLRSNPALSAILGRSAAELTGLLVTDLVKPEDRGHVDEALAGLSGGATPTARMFVRCPRPDGTVASLDINLAAWTDARRAAGFVVEAHDVTAWRSSEDELRRVQTHLLQSEKMASIGQLAAGVAHEINNPLGYVYSNLHTLADYVNDMLRLVGAFEEAERLTDAQGVAWDSLRAVRRGLDFPHIRSDVLALLEETREGLQRVKKIVQDLKEFSHAETNDEWSLADLHKGLDSTLNIVKNELKYKAIVEKAYGDLPLVECVPLQINQVFLNILINAGQAITEKGRIRIATGVTGNEVWIDIGDNGGGIAAQDLPRIFDPFFTTKQAGVGTGLGLSLSYSIVRKHQGRIEVESEPGKGARFRIWLPLLRTPPP